MVIRAGILASWANISKRKGVSSPGPEGFFKTCRPEVEESEPKVEELLIGTLLDLSADSTGLPLASPFPWLELKRVLVFVLTSFVVVFLQ